MKNFKTFLAEQDFKLTPKREKELEKLAKDLPDNDFKKRYGKDWKSVKIATAMNMLKKKYGFKEEGPCWAGYKQVGFKMKNGKKVPNCVPEAVAEAAERIARKKGQHKGSSSHSDLYTDENPKGTIHGLGFKDAETANKGVGIINKANKTHAHKVQATLVMQQRAKEAIKRTKDPEKKANLKKAYDIWTTHLEKLKKKTKEMNK